MTLKEMKEITGMDFRAISREESIKAMLKRTGMTMEQWKKEEEFWER